MNDLITDVLKLIIASIDEPMDFCAFTETCKRNYENSQFMIEKMKIKYEVILVKKDVKKLMDNMDFYLQKSKDLKIDIYKFNILFDSTPKKPDQIYNLHYYVFGFANGLSHDKIDGDMNDLYRLYYLYKLYAKHTNTKMSKVFINLNRNWIPGNIGKSVFISDRIGNVSIEMAYSN